MRARARRGFTLMEILVALFISAMVMTSVLVSLDYTQRAVDAVHNIIETESAGPRVMALLREDLSRLAVVDRREFTLLRGQNESLHGADADQLDFVAYRRSVRPFHDLVRDRDVYAPLVEVGYRLRENPRLADFLELYRREDFFEDEKPFEDGQFTLLYDRMINFDVRYYERPETDPMWEDEWDSTEREGLPFAVEVRMELEVQPRRSMESLGILGANRSRLAFEDIVPVPEEVRWVFRNRLHPVVPGPARKSGEAAQDGAQPQAPGSGGNRGGAQRN
ncbi:MAG: prepilin-type N-terminal cleavage/methylation domain-containing protein [Planctomycetota bacterium]|nr:MAG: prepilin-type N-terminal cleavage/methylation domain-containing protein [Planctomycetota bacterium]